MFSMRKLQNTDEPFRITDQKFRNIDQKLRNTGKIRLLFTRRTHLKEGFLDGWLWQERESAFYFIFCYQTTDTFFIGF